jgi:hypothetical protein
VNPARADAQSAHLSTSDHAPAGLSEDKLCARCHFPNNHVHAPTAIKVVISSSTTGRPSAWARAGGFGLALLAFLLGLTSLVCLWFLGEVAGQGGSAQAKQAAGSEAI